MNTQEVFTKVATHLLTQKVKAKSGQTCAYRSGDGLKCAVGCLIEDDEYMPEMEGHIVEGLFTLAKTSDNSKLKSFYERLGQHQRILTDLQDVHDAWNTEDWRRGLHEVANTYGLTMPEGV